MAGDIWQDLRNLARTRQWAEIVELAGPGDANTVLALTTGEDLGELLTRCRAAAPAVTIRSATFAEARAAPVRVWSAAKLIVALPVPVPEEATRWTTDRPPDSYAVVSDGERLAAFLSAPVSPALPDYRRHRLREAIEARLAAPVPVASVRGTETELLLGVDRLEQRLQRALGAGRLAPADAAHELTIGFRDWRTAGRDAIRARWAGPGDPPGLPELAPVAGPVARPAVPAGAMTGAVGVGATAGVLARVAGTSNELAVLTGLAIGAGWRAHRRQQARRAAATAELAAARQLVADSGTAARTRISRFVETELTTVPADRDTLRAALDALPPDPSPREATRA